MIKVTDKQYWMDGFLKSNLDTIAYNVKRDFDAVIAITGSGMVRVGKSVLAQQAGYYLAKKLKTPFGVDNIVFSGAELMSIARKLPKNSVIIYDEARGELDTKKIMENLTRFLLDFFAECGMYNHVIILVLPDYFELPKTLAISRSEILLNVIRTTSETRDDEGNEVIKFERGIFEFYNRKGKKKLYILGKKAFDDYDIGIKHRSFYGDFPNTFIVDRDAYESKKLEHIQRTRGGNKEDRKFSVALKVLCTKVSQREAVTLLKQEGLGITQARISQLLTELEKPGI